MICSAGYGWWRRGISFHRALVKVCISHAAGFNTRNSKAYVWLIRYATPNATSVYCLYCDCILPVLQDALKRAMAENPELAAEFEGVLTAKASVQACNMPHPALRSEVPKPAQCL